MHDIICGSLNATVPCPPHIYPILILIKLPGIMFYFAGQEHSIQFKFDLGNARREGTNA